MTQLFEGKKIASEIESDLREQVTHLKLFGVTPKLVSIVVGDNEGALMYQKMKQRAAERIGAELEIIAFDEVGVPSHPRVVGDPINDEIHRMAQDNKASDNHVAHIIELISELGKDKTVHGIMIQLPLPKSFSKEDIQKIIDAIPPEKDIDGMREDSSFCTPVAHAVLDAIAEADPYIKNDEGAVTITLVGARGFVGRKIGQELRIRKYEVSELEKDDFISPNSQFRIQKSKIIISCTGVPNLITGDMVKTGIVAIDVGAPKGDFDESVNEYTSFLTPVPGGIGPVTIARLLDNLVLAARNRVKE